VTDTTAAAPKRTAMQVALDAERIAQQALAGGSGGEVADMTGPVHELTEKVGDLLEWRAKLGGRLAHEQADEILSQLERRTGDSLAELRGNLAHITEQLAAMPDYAAGDSQLKPQRLFDATLAVDKRVRDLEEWQAAQLDEDQLGGVDALAERMAEVEAQLREMRAHPSTAVDGRPAAPHVLQLIVALKKQIGAIGKDRRTDHKGGKYDFRGVDDAINAIGNACDLVGIVPPRATVVNTTTQTTAIEGRIWTTSTVTMRYTFQSPIDGSEWSTEGVGEGRDLGDKSLTKAQAGAYKYAMFHGLSIAIEGMNVDAETEHPVMDGRPADQGSHEYRQWENQQEQAEQREYAQQAAAQRQQPEQQRQPDNRSPEELVRDALAAVRRAARVSDAVPAWNWAHQAGYLSFHAEGAQLGQHMLAAIRLLPGGGNVQLPGAENFR
jgi:hypothetical protein